MESYIALLLFIVVCLVLAAGYPVAFSLAGTALAFAWLGSLFDLFDLVFLEAIPNRLFSIMTNDTLVAVPLFVFMGFVLERSRLAENLLETMALLFGPMRGGLGISVTLVGMILAASTGVVGATVVTMGLLSLPTMLRRGYDPGLAAGVICASGSLGQIIPPSIILVLLGDVLGASYQQAQLNMGVFAPKTVSVGDLFVGAILPGIMLVGLFILYIGGVALFQPRRVPAIPREELAALSRAELGQRLLKALLPTLSLIIAVLGAILAGIATPTEAAAVGAVGALLLASMQGQLNRERLTQVVRATTKTSSMVFLILFGATVFSLVFRGYGGDTLVEKWLTSLGGGPFMAMTAVMAVMFLLGFFIDFIEIIFVVVPIVAPVLMAMGLDPVWLGVMMGMNLQTSFLTPPFGFALFYLRGVAPANVETMDIYRGVVPFILLQILALALLAMWPEIATWLPNVVYGGSR